MIDSQIKPLEFDRSWQDAFGTVLACVERGSRKRNLLIVTSSESGQVTLESLPGITFQGRIVLAILDHLHHAPLEAILRNQEPNFVIALEPAQSGIATHGTSIEGNPSLEIASTGLEYAEPGSYPAWANYNALESDPQASSTTGGIVGSVASGLGLPCLVCNPSDLKLALEIAFRT
jgi:hypothetical protein